MTEPSELVRRLRRTRVAIETYWMPLWKERLRNSLGEVKETTTMPTQKQESDRVAMVNLLVVYGWDRARAEERVQEWNQAYGGPRITLQLLELQHLLIAALEHGRAEREIKNDTA